MSLLDDLRHTRFVRHMDGAVQLVHPQAQPLQSRRNDSTYNYTTGLGGLNDKGQTVRPSTWQLSLSNDELQSLFAHNGIARRLTEIIPQRACRRGWMVPGIRNEDRRLQTWSQVCQAMTWARLYGGSALVVVTEDDVAPEFKSRPLDWLQQPLDLKRVGKVLALQPFDAIEATPSKWDRDIRSASYRAPAEWQISSDGFRHKVHASRVIFFRGARRPPSSARSWNRSSLLPDDSALQALWDDLARLSQVMQGGATMAQELRESVLTIGDYSSKATGDEGAELETRLSLMARIKGLLGMILLGPNDKYENRSNPPTGYAELSSGAWEALAAASGVPQVILMGSTPGGLNTDGESSFEGFRQLVSSYQESQRSELERLYTILYSAQDGPTSGEQPEGWELAFAPLDEPKESVVAETRQVVAETDARMIEVGVLPREAVREARYGKGGWAFELYAPQLPTPDPTPTPPAAPGPAAPAIPASVPESAQARPAADALPLPPPPLKQSVCILVPAVDPELRQVVESAIGQTLVPELEPHVTVLYLGDVDPAYLPEIIQAVTEECADAQPGTVERPRLRPFPHGEHGQPIVLEFEDAWSLASLHDRLLVRLAHIIVAKQHARFRPHLTLGYAPLELTAEAMAALVGIEIGYLRVPVVEVRVMHGETLVASRLVGA